MASKKRRRKEPPKEQRLPRKSATSATPAADRAGLVPTGYAELLDDLKCRIRSVQIKAALAMNRELIQLYWEIGRAIVERQQAEGWGAKVIDRLAADLQREFPDVAGLSRTNVYRMRAFYTTWSGVDVIVQHPVEQLRAMPPDVVFGVPWGHNVILVEKVDVLAQHLWYA